MDCYITYIYISFTALNYKQIEGISMQLCLYVLLICILSRSLSWRCKFFILYLYRSCHPYNIIFTLILSRLCIKLCIYTCVLLTKAHGSHVSSVG